MTLDDFLEVTDFYTDLEITVMDADGYAIDNYEGEAVDIPEDFREKYGSETIEEVALIKVGEGPETYCAIKLEIFYC